MAAGSVRSAPSHGDCTEYPVRLAKLPEEKIHHIMRFKAPHKCDLEKLVNPTLERQTVERAEQEELPETGEGSEFGRKRREEARRRRRGYHKRAVDPDDQPWVLKERKKGGKHFIGRKEGTVNSSSSYFFFKLQDGAFEVEPVKNWYDFVPPVKYNYLDADEAEERFEKRNKTLNYFSIMLSKKLKDGEEGEEGASGVKEVVAKEKNKPSADSGLLLTDSDSAGFSSDNDSEGSSADESKGKESAKASKKVNSKNKRKKKQRATVDGVEAGEDTDEGDMESREVDYMSDSSSNSELEFLAKEANKALPKDDEVVERKEEEEIDKGFVESSSSEDELTEKGKELRELMKKLSGDSPGEEEEDEEEEMKETVNMETVDKGMGADSPRKKGSKHSSSRSGKHSKKRDRAADSPSSKGSSIDPGNSLATVEGSAGELSPPAKKPKAEVSKNCITEDEVKRYLMRRPITSKDLVRKFINKKTEMDRNRIVEVLHKVIEGLKNVEKQTVKGKLYLSLKNPATMDLS